VLGLEEDASDAEIARRYHTLARRMHPDVTGRVADVGFKALTEAYNQLKPPTTRAQTDARVAGERQREVDTQQRLREAMAAFEKARREAPSWAASPFVLSSQAITISRAKPPTPFSDVASAFARYRPPSETPWWTIGGAVADILWTVNRK
jgi:curved DNA-binding protein CbpA